MKRLRLKLTPGREYLLTHKRRKMLRARFLRIVRAPGSDPLDEYYLECELVRQPASYDQESSTTLLRPSMISLVQDVPEGFVPPILSGPRMEEGSEMTSRVTFKNAFQRLLRGLRG